MALARLTLSPAGLPGPSLFAFLYQPFVAKPRLPQVWEGSNYEVSRFKRFNPMLLMIDNYDSFTYNVVQYLGELGAEVKVIRNDELTIAQIEALQPERIVVSPGPCTPSEAGVSIQAILHFAGKLPILGVCLGHQSIGQAYGGDVVRARQVMHGKTSPVYHRDLGVFAGLNNPLTVTRYHSLVVKRDTLPDCLEVTAWTALEDGSVDEIMGLRHKTLNVEGVQFHPESILTEQGHELFANFLKQTGGHR
ncbi:aminodeoxychorismate/anthranilate synthase component II [Pseudomonas sp. S60]|nr:aminodeoxychorismate/anthranilate synthase component II [Pseudomonas sp. S36]MBK5008716.1 aminodeoxychorismate/anthranilate synthase component II [Pseudomonas sp. S60]